MIKIYIGLIALMSLAAPTTTDEEVAGTYIKILGNPEVHSFKYTLDLKADGRFSFHYFEDFTNSKKVNPGAKVRIKEKYGKGNWKIDGKIVSFSTEPSDMDEANGYVLDFGNSKARFDFKSPRDKSDRVIPTSIRFYESGIFYMDGITMVKQ